MSELGVAIGETEDELDEAETGAISRTLGFTFWLCVGWIVLIVLAAILAPWLPIKDPDANYINRELGRPPYPPSTTHWFGTDQDARDIFARTIWGARVSLTVGFVAIACGLLWATRTWCFFLVAPARAKGICLTAL